jgi:AbrB family looped-hinge helix DNA binding protein
MIANVSVKGQLVIPEAIREQARIKAGDKLDVGYANGLIVLRKRREMTPARVRSLLLAGRDLPEMTAAGVSARRPSGKTLAQKLPGQGIARSSQVHYCRRDETSERKGARVAGQTRTPG